VVDSGYSDSLVQRDIKAHELALLIVGAALMLWAVWQFNSGLGTIKRADSDPEAWSRSDGTWLS
jgi:hypothetical protein